jgi:hypothetical protein
MAASTNVRLGAPQPKIIKTALSENGGLRMRRAWWAGTPPVYLPARRLRTYTTAERTFCGSLTRCTVAPMLRALVLDALAEGAAAGEDHVARHSLRGIDPAIRWRVRQRVVARVRVASASVADSSDRAHVLRLAFLGEAGCDDVDFEDRVQVLAAFEKASGQRPRPRLRGADHERAPDTARTSTERVGIRHLAAEIEPAHEAEELAERRTFRRVKLPRERERRVRTEDEIRPFTGEIGR